MLLVSPYSSRPFAQCHLGHGWMAPLGWIEADYFFVGISYASFQSAIKLFRALVSESQYQRLKDIPALDRYALKGLAL